MSQVIRKDYRPEKVFINLYGTLKCPQHVFLLWLTEQQYNNRNGDQIKAGDGVIILSSFESQPGSQKLVFQAGVVLHTPIEVDQQWTYNEESGGKPETMVVPIVGPCFENSDLSNSDLYYEIYRKRSNFRSGLTLPGGHNWQRAEEQKRAINKFMELRKSDGAIWSFH